MTENEGFFKYFRDELDKTVDDTFKNEFGNLDSDGKRISYVCDSLGYKSYNLASDLEKIGNICFPVQKDFEEAKRLKAVGNEAFQKGNWTEAVRFYSMSIINTPQAEGEELAKLYANRSAALNHLTQNEAALEDIKRCLTLNKYPKELQYKVLERKARCLLILNRNDEAMRTFREIISALDNAKIDDKKRQKMTNDAKIMVEMLKQGLKLAGNPKDPEPIVKTIPVPKLSSKSNPKYPAASDAIDIQFNENAGRFAVATKDVNAGEILLVEKAYSSVLLAEYSKTHCHNCFTRALIPVACPNCPNVVFCTEMCRFNALKTYHRYECLILPLLWRSGCSITCLMAFRMITQNKLEFLKKLYPKLAEKPSGVYETCDYKNVYHLVTHAEKRSREDFLHRTQMAAFFVKLLDISGYFDGSPRSAVTFEDLKSMAVDTKYKEDIALIGGLVLRNFQLLQFNAHEVFELVCPKPEVEHNVLKHNGKSVFIAGAVFPTLALFNHSCDPGVVRYFSGNNIVVRAVKNIRKGQEVAENYGPIFTTEVKAKRQATLKDQYWFDCNCLPCQQDWPLYDDMNENYMRFKCDSDVACPNVVPVPHDCSEFMVQCGLCQQYTNIMKGLKALQDTDGLANTGKKLLEDGKYGDALKKFVQVLKLYDQTLAPPYRAYYDCMQNLRKCMLAMGNYSLASV